ncbi:hypothetical protein SPSYN_00511 [Sporotomaculum syntrophicum]|uniref:Copper amine oxidase-like N-terminal domain-containing protein n=1 Tax=Sporotomaculum syntrophicum TaxID=182264 RepID=A0A9D3AY81_9FIRM|nr:stalk domain-containing protein [Sporotomaculum syntrophicum]KAF1085782.1 hypothetical protein SPSYN_00511 [Sporotomaculum syntrophicum]
MHGSPSRISVILLAGLFCLASVVALLVPAAAFAAGGDITISGSGLNIPGPITITQSQLRGTEALSPDLQSIYGEVYLTQHDEWYSTINTWPTKSWYRGEGVKLTDLFKLAGGINDDATQIRFTSTDGFKVTFTVDELLNTPRYRFPNFMSNGLSGHLPGDPSGAEPVEAIIAHRSFYVQNIEDVTGEHAHENFSRSEANHLIYGQRAVTQQTNARFAKYVTKIEVLTDDVPQWDEPTSSVDPGEVEVGTFVELHSLFNDEDKVHYTLDGSTPTIDSPMYNWIASRWWSSRSDVLNEINHPIEITDNTTIKARVIGPGRADSDVVTFEYRVPLAINTDNPARAIQNKAYAGHTFRAVGGVEPHKFAITDGALPGGMSLNGAVLEGTPSENGTFTFTVTITDSAEPVNTDSHEFTLIVDEAGAIVSPTLTADTTNNTVGQPIELTFVDNAAWRNAITDVTVNGTSITGKYSVAEGVITIEAGVFDTTGNYTIVVIATGYPDAGVTQKITTTSGQLPGDEKVVLEITGDGVATSKKYTQFQLEEMPQYQNVYSCINTWPSKKWYIGKGVSLRELLNEAGIKGSAKLIKFFSSDGYYMTLTVQELLRDSRYRFPNFKSGGGDGDGHIPGSSSGAVEVEPIIALVSAEGTDNPSYMNDANTPLLMLGQRTVTEQTGPLFTKYINKIEVSTNSPGKWDKPTAELTFDGEPVKPYDNGTVPAGTMVHLKNNNMDQDKIHYTTDGSTPTLESLMYNWIAKRWWSSRGEETVARINHPIELTGDTTIKAITIGPGRSNSDVATFTYKVTGTTDSRAESITSDKGGTVSLGKEVVIEIPAGALAGTRSVEVKIERVPSPPAAPAGFKILDDVYEFTVDGKSSCEFKKAVTIKLRFDPDEVSAGETPAVHYYDETEKKWVNIGGEVSDDGDTISVQVEHFTKFTVMVAVPITVTATINPSEGGTVSLGKEAVIEIPAGALAGTGSVEVKIGRVSTPPAAPTGFKFLDGVYEFSVDGYNGYQFNKPVTISLEFEPEKVSHNATPTIHYYEETGGKWVDIGGEVSNNTITVRVDYVAKFAVMVRLPVTVTAIIEPSEGGTVSLGEEVVIEIPADALKGISPVEVKIERVTTPIDMPTGFKLISGVYEFSVDDKTSYSFNKAVTVKLSFDTDAILVGEAPSVYYYDENKKEWVGIGGELSSTSISVQLEHFTKFAVMVSEKVVKVINFTIGEMAATVNGIVYPLDAVPYIDTLAGRTLVPARFVSEVLGAEVSWLSETSQICIKDDDKEIILTLGSSDVLVNNVKQTIDCAPTILPPGRTFTPLRFVSETLGAKVDYVAETNDITITR